MDRASYYRQMRELAREQRLLAELEGARVLKSDLRKLFKYHGVQVDLWPISGAVRRKALKNLRGAYIDHPVSGPCVMISRDIPDEPQIFTMAHELKHHLVDRGSITAFCHEANTSDVIEIGAEVFAAELIFPQQLFIDTLTGMGVVRGGCQASDIVKLKRDTQTTLSYAGLAKRAEFMRFAPVDSLKGVKWKKLEESIYGEPVYKRIIRQRRSKSAFDSE